MEPLEYIEQSLRENSGEANRISQRHYFREEVHVLGVGSAKVREIARNALKMVGKSHREEIFSLCEALWRSAWLEECSIACELTFALRKSYVPGDFEMLERWVANYVSNWANCDSLCSRCVGSFLEMYPSSRARLVPWTKSENRWQRRASAVSLIFPARRGLAPLAEILAIADALLTDGDDMVQKGYGWLLKESSKVYRDEIFNYLMARRATMARTALRYALEKMPPEMRKIAMERCSGGKG
ncbi:MAG: DNA alkylation repair protein [Rickettsiales bacterium]|jgi:3-methyladenine DNA glycosylase AlkD|nr:DNA alkylation repair protein [Rickettsiales bacterium]